MGELRVGCAGWYYQDWVGAVYPRHVEPSRWLTHYASLFPLVEVDATFYELPPERTVAGWLDRVQSKADFTFAAKAPRKATHEALPRGDLEAAQQETDRFLDRVVRPLEAAGRFEAVLVQLPPTFALVGHAGKMEPLEALLEFLRTLEPTRRRVAVEFRHGSWYEHVGEHVTPEAIEGLSGLRVAACRVDGLGSRLHDAATTDWSYTRLHGRRTQIPPSERSLAHAKYDYLYSREEIGDLATSIGRAASGEARTVVVFNNHYRGQAPRNGLDLLEALGQPLPEARVTLSKTPSLDEFAT